MATYMITHPTRPTAQIHTAGNSVVGALTETPGLPGHFAPVDRHAHSDIWDEIVDAYQGAPGNGYTASLKALLTLTDFENAPTGTTVVSRGSRIAYTKKAPNQWHEPIDEETVSDEHMAQRGAAYTV